jgi:hypothetical protein
VFNPHDGERERLPIEAARGLLPPGVQAAATDEPERAIEAFFQEVLGPVRERAGD